MLSRNSYIFIIHSIIKHTKTKIAREWKRARSYWVLRRLVCMMIQKDTFLKLAVTIKRDFLVFEKRLNLLPMMEL